MGNAGVRTDSDLQLESVCKSLLGSPDEKCHLFPSLTYAEACRAYLETYAPSSPGPGKLRVAKHAICVPSPRNGISPQELGACGYIELYIAFFPADLAPLAKSFWQHTGTGISSRMAEYCLSILSHETEVLADVRARAFLHETYPTPKLKNMPESNGKDDMGMLKRTTTSLHALPLVKAADAKRVLQRRIADLVVEDASMEMGARIAQRIVCDDDVVLFPTGMSAIWHTHLALVEYFPGSKSVAFG